MKKTAIFFAIHLFMILTLSTYLFIDAAFNKDKKMDIFLLGSLKTKVYDSPFIRPYMILSGINTGYGFYGINVATNKYVKWTPKNHNIGCMGWAARFLSLCLNIYK